MTNDTNNLTHTADHAAAPIPTDGGDEMTQQTETTGPTTQRSPGSESEAPKPRKKGSGKNGYPFLTKRAILTRLDAEPPFVLECLQIMDRRQTEDEREAKETRYKNARGWMSSHAVNGTILAAKARDEGLTAEEFAKVQAMVSRYGKQLAAHFRNKQVAATPEVANKAAAYFMG